MKKIFEIITVIIAILVIFLGFIVMILNVSDSYTNSMIIIGKYILNASICIIFGFITTIILKRVNTRYKFDNDSYLWICKNLIFLNFELLISFVFKEYYVIQFIVLIIYIFTTLTIMIMYNEYICLSKQDIEIRKRLFSLREYLKEMQYLRDKEVGNSMTYEKC